MLDKKNKQWTRTQADARKMKTDRGYQEETGKLVRKYHENVKAFEAGNRRKVARR